MGLWVVVSGLKGRELGRDYLQRRFTKMTSRRSNMLGELWVVTTSNDLLVMDMNLGKAEAEVLYCEIRTSLTTIYFLIMKPSFEGPF